jgi:hypothetical protein
MTGLIMKAVNWGCISSALCQALACVAALQSKMKHSESRLYIWCAITLHENYAGCERYSRWDSYLLPLQDATHPSGNLVVIVSRQIHSIFQNQIHSLSDEHNIFGWRNAFGFETASQPPTGVDYCTPIELRQHKLAMTNYHVLNMMAPESLSKMESTQSSVLICVQEMPAQRIQHFRQNESKWLILAMARQVSLYCFYSTLLAIRSVWCKWPDLQFEAWHLSGRTALTGDSVSADHLGWPGNE